MAKCIVCGKEANSCLCDECRDTTDLEQLCKKIVNYRPGTGENPLWDEISAGMDDPYDFRELVFTISADMRSPRKEYWRIMSACGASSNVPKARRQWFYGTFDAAVSAAGLSDTEKNRLYGIALGARSMDYDYEAAEKIAVILGKEQALPWQCFFNLSEYYTTTRRYDMADKVIKECLQQYGHDDFICQMMGNQADKNSKQRGKALEGKQEYMPNPRENRDEVRKKYVDFLSTIGIEAAVPAATSRAKNVIPRDKYPKPVETKSTDFTSFVAFDVETTGISSSVDSIIEIGAIKVVGDQVVESKKFCFQELVQPLNRKKVSEKIESLTGITNAEAYAARPIWEVLPDFMSFAGDSVLVGFNCISFDSRFMVRAGRYSNIIIENKYFDVMLYANQFKAELGIDAKRPSLNLLAEKLRIENPRAHRALADAITTAKVYLELKKRQLSK